MGRGEAKGDEEEVVVLRRDELDFVRAGVVRVAPEGCRGDDVEDDDVFVFGAGGEQTAVVGEAAEGEEMREVEETRGSRFQSSGA